MKTTLPKDPGSDREWLLVDADSQVLGKLSVQVANMLRGRDKPTYTPQVDTGAFVVVVNAGKVKLTGKKDEQKVYHRYSGYRGGLRGIKAAVMRERHPDRIVRLAVKGMLPNNRLSRRTFRRLKVYAGPDHPHAAQKVKKVELR